MSVTKPALYSAFVISSTVRGSVLIRGSSAPNSTISILTKKSSLPREDRPGAGFRQPLDLPSRPRGELQRGVVEVPAMGNLGKVTDLDGERRTAAVLGQRVG